MTAAQRQWEARQRDVRDAAALVAMQADDLPNEEWRPVAINPAYSVSSLGRVRRVRAGKGTRVGLILRAPLGKNGYPGVCLGTKRPDRKLVYVHRLVAAAFLGACPAGYEVNHIDGEKANNRVENLEYVSHRRNSEHARVTGLSPRVGHAKLTDAQALEVRASHRSAKELAAHFGVSPGAIFAVRRGATFSHLLPRRTAT